MNASERIKKSLALLDECLWDDIAWSGEDLVARMEAVYETLGGDLSNPPDEDAAPPTKSGASAVGNDAGTGAA